MKDTLFMMGNGLWAQEMLLRVYERVFGNIDLAALWTVSGSSLDSPD